MILRVALLLATILLVACTPSARQEQIPWPQGAPPQNLAIIGTPITLQVWLAADYVNQGPIIDLVSDFERAYPNITIKLSGYVWEDMDSKVRLAISQGTPPDIAHQHAFAMGAQGLAEPLDDLWNQWGTEHEFMQGALDDITWKGVRYGVPLDINALFMIYNRAAFEQAGLQPPGPGYTFSQLRSDLHRLTAPDGSRLGIALSSSGWDMYGLVRSNGGELFVERGGRTIITFDTPAVREVLSLYTELGWKDRVGSLPPPQPRQSDHPVQLFSNRKVAVFFSGPWDLTRLKQEAPPEIMAEVGTALLPVPTADAPSGSVLGGGSLFVPKGSRNREAAFEFMKWAVAERYALRMAKEMGRYPVRRAPYENGFLKQEPLLGPFLEQLLTARPYKLEAYAAASAIWDEAVRAAFAPSADVPAILAEAERRAQLAVDATQ